jgi:hypothetical protein
MCTRNIEPAPVTLAGAPVARIASSMPFRARSVSALRRATAGWSNFSTAAMPAVMLIGCALVSPWCFFFFFSF